MLRIQIVCEKVILMCLVPVLIGVIYDCIICSNTPLKDLAPIDEVKEVLIHIRFNIVHRYQECAELNLMRSRAMRRLVWFYAIWKCSLF